MLVDSYRFLPRSFRALYENVDPPSDGDAFTPMEARLAEARIALLTSAGLHVLGEQEPFDLDRERREPLWGDPTHRVLPADLPLGAHGMSHLHVRNDDVLADRNVALPLDRLAELAESAMVGDVAPSHYSVMGYQGPLDTWRDDTAPAIVERLRDERVHGVVLAPV